MASTFPADEAKLVSIFMQTLLYGVFCPLFFATIIVLRRKVAAQSGMSKVMMGTAITMFILATMHIGVNFTRIIKAFIIFKNEPGGPAAYFNELSNFTNIFGSTIYVAQTLLGDGFVLYRCAVVCGRKYWIVAFPGLLLMGSTVTGIGILYSFAKVAQDAEIFLPELGHWIVSFFTLTLATNLICTGLVAARVWKINKMSERVGTANLMPVLLVIVESGAIYSATLLTLLFTYVADSWAQYLLLDAVSPIVGITFSLVILRLSLGLTAPDGVTRTFHDLHTHNYGVGSSLWAPPSVAGKGDSDIQLSAPSKTPSGRRPTETQVSEDDAVSNV
ncbi:hypothetical protein JAAARDRAFT_186972 [Jaapia argillacea MUCL 33604]|uniref:Uncharacterized protein n=1 Tax=Jaapia argillacea MUCL 33604 TaxID=933084 RepID=A0A067PEV7_9AGAM|nr:hypothetical protein JAAARDRAFT_186972 [Jaapia argillacea MUCL 33604]